MVADGAMGSSALRVQPHVIRGDDRGQGNLSVVKECIDIRQQVEPGERSRVCNFPRDVQESGPCCARERAAHTNPANAQSSRLLNRHERRVDQQVHRLGRYCGNDGGNVFCVVNPRSVQAIGADFRISA